MARRVTLSDRYGSGVTWSGFPALEDIYDEMAGGGRKDRQEQYFKAVVAACREEGALALAIELSVVDRRNSVSDVVAFHTSFYGLRLAPVELILSRRGDTLLGEPLSPYEEAMAAMTGEGGTGPAEPIVLHPGLRDPELLYLISPPLGVPFQSQDIPHYSFEPSRTWEGTLLRSATSKVESQVGLFRSLLQAQVRELDRGLRPSTGRSFAEDLFEGATLLVVPFLRDPWGMQGQSEAVGAFRDFTTQAGGATGLVAFVWLVTTDDERQKNLSDRVAARILELHRVLMMKDSLHKSYLLVRKNHFIQTAAHDITTHINTLQLERVRSHFFKGVERDEIKPSQCRFRLELGQPDEDDADVRVVAEFAASAEDVHEFVKGMLQAVEIGTGPRYIRDKFQCRRSFTADEMLSQSLERANRWSRSAYGPAKFVWHRMLRCEARMSVADDTFVFPTGYYSMEVLSAQLTEVIINARKFGQREADGAVPIDVSLFTRTVGGDDYCCLELANYVDGRIERVSEKTSPLNYAEGLEVVSRLDDRLQGQRYSVEFGFGPAPRELFRSGVLEVVAPAYTGIQER